MPRTDPKAVAQAVERQDSFPLRIAIGTVGRNTVAPMLALTGEALAQSFEINVISALHLIRHSAPWMVPHGGSVVLT